MKKFRLLRFIILVCCASTVIGCRTTKQQSVDDTKNEDANDRGKRQMDLDSSTSTDTPTHVNNEAEIDSSTVVNDIAGTASIMDPISNTTNVPEGTEISKYQKKEESYDPIPSNDEEKEDEIKSRKTRQKTYKCYCEEATYQSDCLKKCQNAEQFAEDDSAQDRSIEITENPLEAYTNTVPRITTESIKFNIPYAKNGNFDQKIILGSAHPQSYKILSNGGINIPKNRIIPVYPQTSQMKYAITYPGMVQNGMPAIKQNYLTSVLRKPASKGTYMPTYMPSRFGENFANIQECIKLYGQTVCLIVPTTNTPLSNNDMTTTGDYMIGNSKGKDVNKNDESCTDNQQNKKLIFLNNGQNKNIHKSFNGKNYLNKNNMYVGIKAIPPNSSGTEKQLNYFETLEAAPKRPVTQKPVYATKYPFPTTPSYVLNEYDKPRNHISDAEKSNEYLTTYKTTMHEKAGQNRYFESGKETTGYPTIQFHYPTTVPSNRHDYVQDLKFVTNSPVHRYEAEHSPLNEIQTIVGDRYTSSPEREMTNYPNLLEQASISQGMSPSNTEKNRKVFISKEYNYNNNEKVTSSEMQNSYTSNYVEQTTEQNTFQTNSDDLGSIMLTSTRNKYDDISKPISFSLNSQRNDKANYEDVNYYKLNSAQSKDNELYYSSNEALHHENYKNYERPQPQFDYSKFPQSMTRIINEANGQYMNGKYPQYHPGNILKERPDGRVYESSKNYYTGDPRIPIYTTISIPHTTPPSMQYNNKESINNEGNYYPTTDVYDVRGERLPSNSEYQNRYNTQVPLQSLNLKKQDMLGYPEKFDNAEIPNVKYNSKFESNAFASKVKSDSLSYTTKSFNTLENLENNEFKKHYNPIITTPRSTYIPTLREPVVQSRKYPGTPSKAKIRLQMFNDTEGLFRGLEKIILDNYDPPLSRENVNEPIESSAPKESAQTTQPKIAEKILFGNLDEGIKENVQKYGHAGVSEIESSKLPAENLAFTENPIQTVDDIPATVRDNVYFELTTPATVSEASQQTINELVQNTIRKVINNFVPGKAEDLIGNYENKNAKEIVGAKVSDLLPEIVGTPVVRKLLTNPTIENMIIDVAGGLMGRMTNIAINNIAALIKPTYRKVVNNEIPKPSQTFAPFTVEEHRFQNGEWVTEHVSLLGSARTKEITSLPREVFNKIKSILYQSELTEKEAAQPIVQNLIVKAVKHSLNKDRDIIQESAVRKAYKIIVQPTKSKTSPAQDATAPAVGKKATIAEPRATTEPYELYKLAPIIRITESNYNKGNWKESQKLLVDPSRKKVSTGINESAKEALQKQLEKVKKIKVTSEEDRHTEVSNINFENSSQYEYEGEGGGEGNDDYQAGSENEGDYDDEYSVIEGSAKEKISLNNVNDETVDIDRQPIKYYSPNDRVLEYIKTHKIGAHSSFSTTAEIIGKTSTYDTTSPMSVAKSEYSKYNEPEENKSSFNQNFNPKQSATSNGRNLGQNNQSFGNPLKQYSPQSADNMQVYVGRLIPADNKVSQAKDLNDLENSNLIYVGDGARLPLTIKKLADGTFALTLSDVLCKQFIHKECPCCLEGNRNGNVVREQKSIKDGAEWNISNNNSDKAEEKISPNTESYSKDHIQYQDRESSGVTTPSEHVDANISPHLENLKGFQDQSRTAPFEEQKHSNTNIYLRTRRESEEQKESVQEERVDQESFMKNHIENSIENEDNTLFINNAKIEKGNQNDGLQIDNNESGIIESQSEFSREDSFEVVPRMIGPYRYQQLYAKENADALRNMFYMMQ